MDAMKNTANLSLGGKRLRSPFFSLLSSQMKLSYGARGLAEQFGLGKRSKWAYVLLGFLGLSFFPMIGQIYKVASMMAFQSVALGQPGFPIISAVVAAQFLVLFIGISSVMSVLYYSNDMDALMGLPFTPGQIMVVKLLVAYVSQALFGVVAAGPFVVALGQAAPIPEYWPYAALVMIAIPGIPLALSLLFSVLIMRVTKGSQKREYLRVVLGLVFFILVMGVQYLNTSLMTKDPQAMMGLLMERNGLVQAAAGYYPPLKWAANALAGNTAISRLSNLLLFVGSSGGALVLVTTLTQGMFFGAATKEVAAPSTTPRIAFRTAQGTLPGAAPGAASGATPSTAPGTASGITPGPAPSTAPSMSTTAEAAESKSWLDLTPVRSPGWAVAMRDHVTLLRTSNFLLTTSLNMVILPLMLVFSAIGGRDAMPFLAGAFEGGLLDTVVFAAIAIHGVMVAANQVGCTALSREGKGFWISKMIPVSATEQVRAKFWYSLIPAGIQVVVLVLTCWLGFKIPFQYLSLVLVQGGLIALPMTAIGILVDLQIPKLKWDNPHQAMKGNFGSLLALLGGAGYVGLLALVVRTMLRAGSSFLMVNAVGAGILLASGLALINVLDRVAEIRYQQIEP